MNLELVIFDMDGLMFDSERACYTGWIKALDEMGYISDLDTYIKTIGTGSSEACAIYKEKYGSDLDYDKLSLLTGKYKQEFIEIEGLGVKKGLLELIRFLDEKKIKRAIASSSSRNAILKNLDMTGIKNDFDYIISGREIKRTKPDPEIFVKVCEDLNIPRENALVLEDSLNGIRAAFSGGIKCIAVPDMVPVDDEIKEKAYRIEESLIEVKNFLKNII